MSALTRVVLRYKNSGAGLEEVHRRISMIVYDYPNRKHGLDEDVCGEFLLYMMPEIERMIRRYEPRDVPFEHYLAVCMRWKLKSFLRAKKQETIRQQIEYDLVVWSELTPSLELAEPSTFLPDKALTAPDPAARSMQLPTEPRFPESPAVGDDESQRRESHDHERAVELKHILRDFNARNAGLLFFCLKAICDVRETELPRIARLCNVGVDWLTHCRVLLTGRCAHRRERMAHVRAKQQLLFERLRELEYRLYVEPDPDLRNRLKRRINRLNDSYRKTSSEAERVNLRPSNYDIAELLGVPKGSVDSGVAKAREILSGIVREVS